MVLLLPPAPAARVLLGLALAIFSFWSAAARRRMAVRGPPGGVGDEGRATLPEAAPTGVPTGEEARGEDCIEDSSAGMHFPSISPRFPVAMAAASLSCATGRSRAILRDHQGQHPSIDFHRTYHDARKNRLEQKI